jgi:hypothetical protein
MEAEGSRMDQSKPLTTPRLSVGSLHALRLGAQTLDDLATLVNWGNSKDFAAPTLVPWVEIEPSPSIFHNESSVVNATSQASASQTSPVAEEDPQLGTTTDGEETPVTLEHAALSEHAQDTDTTHEEPQLSKNEADEEEQIRIEPPDDTLGNESDTYEAAVAEVDEHPETLAPMTGTEEVPDAVAAVGTTVPPQPASTPAQAEARVQDQTVMKTREAPSMTNARPKAIDSSEYLRRLETLVLGLNAQLAQQTQVDETKPQDELTWLRQRVIDLSLHNLELQEQLSSRKN